MPLIVLVDHRGFEFTAKFILDILAIRVFTYPSSKILIRKQLGTDFPSQLIAGTKLDLDGFMDVCTILPFHVVVAEGMDIPPAFCINPVSKLGLYGVLGGLDGPADDGLGQNGGRVVECRCTTVVPSLAPDGGFDDLTYCWS